MRWNNRNPLSRLLTARCPVRARPPLELEMLEPLILLSPGAGTGLTADYYSDANLTNLAATRTDATVNFDWAGASPAPSVAANNFSVRWTGEVQAQYSETYTFFTQSTHGVRLWVNGQLIINDWTNHPLTEDSATVALQAGQTYSISMEYSQTTGDDTARLLWSSPSTPKQIIPASQLYPGGGWLDGDVGTPSVAGSFSSSGSTYTVAGSGVSQASLDQGHFAYQTLNGDGTIIAQVAGVQNTGAAAGAGVMIRNGLGANASFAAVLVAPGEGATFEYRNGAGTAASQVSLTGASAPYWVKLVRDGNVLDGYVSATGADGSWTLVGTANVSMSLTVDVGLWVTAGNAGLLNNSTFNNISVTPAVPVGANVGAVNYYSLDNAFVDMTKQAEFLSLANTSQPAAVDANGWPTQDFQAIFDAGTPDTAQVLNGTYSLSFTGQASMSPAFTPGGAVTNQVYNAATNTTTANFTVNASNSADGWYIVLDFSNTNGGVKNLKLIRPGYAPNTTQVFTNQFLSELSPFGVLRTMDFTETNNNPVVNWSDRSQVTDATQSTDLGVAWQYVIDLANATQKDLWINIPEGATDAYVTQLATLIKQQLDPGLVVYVEYSNELWNGSFSQFNANVQAAVAEVTAGMASGTPSPLFYPGETAQNADGSYVAQYDWAWRRIAQRIEQISADFSSVWGAGAINNQIRPVLASQMSNPYILQTGLQFLQNTYGSPSQYLYAVAGAPYFNLNGQDSQTNLTSDQVLAALSASIAQVTTEYAAYADLATYYGLRMDAYEGGPDTFGPNNIAAKEAASLGPAMTALVTTYLDSWFAAGGGLFNWYLAGPTNYDTQYGTYGLTDDVTNLNSPKMQGIEDVLNATPPMLTGGYPIPGVISANDFAGATPTTNPYPRYLQNGNTLDYLVQAPQSGTYNLQINYAAVNPNEQLQIIVNDHVVTTLTLLVTGPDYDSQFSPDDFANSQPVSLNLNQGLNVVRLEVIAAGFTINQLQFSAPAPVIVQGPTVAAAAGAVVNAAGTTASLTVLGADPAGEAHVTYTWSVLAAPAGAPAPTFAANGTNAAKNTTVTFGAAGAYTLQAIIRDPAGLSVVSSVNVVVGQVVTSVAVTPASVSLAAGASLQFAAAAKDQFGAVMAAPPTFTWTVRGSDGGNVGAGGLYKASAAGGGVDTVTASAGGLAGTGVVTVASAAPPTINFANGFASTTGLSLNGSAQATGGRLRLTSGQAWQGGSAYYATRVSVASFSTSFSFQLTNANADGFAFVIQGTGATPVGAYGSGLGYVGVPNSVAIRFDLSNDTGAGNNATGLSVNGAAPASPTDLGKSGLNLHSGDTFNVAVIYNGATLVVTITDAVTGASASQSYTVNIASVVGSSNAYVGFSGATGNKAATQDILNWTFSAVQASPGQPPTVATAANASPNPVTGTSASLSVLGADGAGEAGLTYTWSVVSPLPAGASTPTFSANGTNAAKNTMVTFGAAGSYILQATIRDAAGLSVASSVTVVVNQTLTAVVVTPGTARLADRARQQFTAVANDQFGNPLTVQPSSFTWSVSGAAGGTVSQTGLYTAPASGAGAAVVTAAAGLSGNAAVTVTAGQASPVLNYSNGFASTAGLTVNGSAAVVGSRLRLTNGQTWQGGSVYSTAEVSVAAFTTSFSFQLTNANADGFAFVIQGTGATPVGAYGSGLGYVGVPNSVAIRFDLSNDTGAGNNATGLSVNGAAPASPTDLGKSGINLHSGDTFNVAVTYNGATLVVTITDAVTGASASQSYTVNIPSVVGSSNAYVGFSGATGNKAATQDILNWAYYATN